MASRRAILEALDLELKDDPRTPAEPHERRRGSRRNAPGSASSANAGIVLSPRVSFVLWRKVETHNATHRKRSQRASWGALAAVWRRGAGAFSRSHRPSQNRSSWAMARVNAYLHLLSTGRPKNPRYVQDNDLLPSGHPAL